MGKTSFLKYLAGLNVPVAVGDYAEGCEKMPLLREKRNNEFLQLSYMASLWVNFEEKRIYDRAPFEVPLYCLVWDLYEGKIERKKAIEQIDILVELLHWGPASRSWKGIYFLAKDPLKTWRRMKERKNPIDKDLTLDYILIQNFIFQYFVNKMGFDIYEVEFVYDIKDTILKEVFSFFCG